MTIASYVELKYKNVGGFAPVYSTDGAGAFDIATSEDEELWPGSEVICKTGLFFEIPPGYVMLVFSRSGMGFKENIRLANAVGVIDSDYRGELMVKLVQDTPKARHRTMIHDVFLIPQPYALPRGTRIAQAILLPYPRLTFTEIETLTETQRGEQGFGSTGA